MAPAISADHLRRLRNEIDIRYVIVTGLGMLSKERDGYLRFLCPICSDFHTATHSATNLARCFRCQQNFNTIDLTMIVRRCSFLDAVRFLNRFRNDKRSDPEPLHHLP